MLACAKTHPRARVPPGHDEASLDSALPESAVVADAVCLGCGCACDDITLVIRDRRIVEARHACALGLVWFGDGSLPKKARIGGRDVSEDEALDEASRLLRQARAPLVYLAPDLTCEAQRQAVALADRLRAILDSITSATAAPSILSAQERGRAGATLGEIRHRADLLVFWGVDPALRYPRYWTRYAPEPAGLHLPHGRRSRTVAAVDVGESRGPADADLRVTVTPEEEVAALTLVAEAVAGRRATRRAFTSGDTPGIEAAIDLLIPAFQRARYVALVADAEEDARRDAGRMSALNALAQILNESTRCAISVLRDGGNRSGADAVMASQTGYPMAVDFARGYPRYRPYGGTAGAALARNEVDALLVAGSTASLPAELLASMAHVAGIVLGPRASEGALRASRVVIDTGIAGIHDSGTALRMDDVPLPLRLAVEGRSSTEALLRALRTRIGGA